MSILWLRDGRSGRETKKVYERVNVVYFARCGKRLKIGTTDHAVRRMTQLQAGSSSKIELLGLIYGSSNVERWCQFRCIDHRAHGEWFKWNAWTKGFTSWVLAHGEEAGGALCPPQLEADDAYDPRDGRRLTRIDMPTMPRSLSDKAERDSYKARCERQAPPMGSCRCDLCAAKPWESWQ